MAFFKFWAVSGIGPPLLPASWERPQLLDALQQQRSKLMPYALDHTWVDKDPRLCITYPAYLHILLRRIPLWFPFVNHWRWLLHCMHAMVSV